MKMMMMMVVVTPPRVLGASKSDTTSKSSRNPNTFRNQINRFLPPAMAMAARAVATAACAPTARSVARAGPTCSALGPRGLASPNLAQTGADSGLNLNAGWKMDSNVVSAGTTRMVKAMAQQPEGQSGNVGGIVRGVLFDMDGVLCDSEHCSREAGIELFKEMGFTVVAEDFIPFMGTGKPIFLCGMFFGGEFRPWIERERICKMAESI